MDDQGNLIKKLVPEKETHDGDSSSNNNDDDEDEEPEEDVRLSLDLPEGCLEVNLGIPIIIAVQKVDVLLHGDKRQFLE